MTAAAAPLKAWMPAPRAGMTAVGDVRLRVLPWLVGYSQSDNTTLGAMRSVLTGASRYSRRHTRPAGRVSASSFAVPPLKEWMLPLRADMTMAVRDAAS